MAFEAPYRQAHFMGNFANDAAALAFIQAQLWDSLKTGLGTPVAGMIYYDTTLNVMKHYQNGAWESLADRTWVTAAIVAGKTWKELLLVNGQLVAGGAGGIAPAIALTTTAILTGTGVALTIDDGAAPETYTEGVDFAATGTIAGDLAAIAAAINGASALWYAVVTTGLDRYFATVPATQLVIYRQTAIATAACNDRLYGNAAAIALAVQVVDFATALQSDYEVGAGTEATIVAVDPAARTFGFGRAFAALQADEQHGISEDQTSFAWNEDDQAWHRSMVPDTPRNFQLAGNPNAGAGTAGAIGDTCVDTVGGVGYRNLDGTATGWVVAF